MQSAEFHTMGTHANPCVKRLSIIKELGASGILSLPDSSAFSQIRSALMFVSFIKEYLTLIAYIL